VIQRKIVSFHAGGKPYALKFNHQNLRDVVVRTSKSIGDLLGDPFYGWPELLAEGLRWKHRNVNYVDTCKLIEDWKDDGQEFTKLGELITDALVESGYLRRTEAEEEENSEGKAQSPNILPAA
jgi:hypothetical protein